MTGEREECGLAPCMLEVALAAFCYRPVHLVHSDYTGEDLTAMATDGAVDVRLEWSQLALMEVGDRVLLVSVDGLPFTGTIRDLDPTLVFNFASIQIFPKGGTHGPSHGGQP